MSLRTMGSTAPGLVTTAEAAKMLGLDVTTFRSMVRRGMIHPAHGKGAGGSSLFALSDIAALADLRFQNLDLATVATMAMRALVLSRNNEKRLNHVTNLLGLNVPSLGTTESEVIALFIEAQDLVQEDEELTAAEAHRWAGIFYAMDEAYLRLVAHYGSTNEPWEPFLALAQKLCENAPRAVFSFNKELESAYAYLEAGRRHLRTVVYFYFRAKNGARAADASFLEMDGSIDAEIAGLLFRS